MALNMKKSKTKNILRFISYYKPYKTLLTINIIAAVFTAALSLILPLCVRHITNNILVPGATDVLFAILQIY